MDGSKSQKQNVKKGTSFTGLGVAATQVLRYLQTNQAWGASAVDAGCMGLPRTAVDSKRGADAGLETARREFTSTFNHMAIGFYGAAAAWFITRSFNKQFGGIEANKLFVSDDMLDIVAHSWQKQTKVTPDPELGVFKDVMSKIKGFKPEGPEAGKKCFVFMNGADQEEIANIFHKADVIDKKAENKLRARLGVALGSEHLVLEDEVKDAATKAKRTIKTEMSLDSFIETTHKLVKTLSKAKKTTGIVANTSLAENAFLQGLKKINGKASFVGLAIAGLVGLGTQPLNAYLTKKKTGKTGFVGGGKEDKSTGFKVLKTAVAATGAFAIFSSIKGLLISRAKVKEAMHAVRFKGLVPTLNQFKMIYGITIVSRLLSARNKNELRESATKDSLGFVNWLIFGGFVSTLAAKVIEKLTNLKHGKFIKYNEAENGKGLFKWLTNSKLVTRDEVLYEAIAKDVMKTAIDSGEVAFKDLMKLAPEAKTKLRLITVIQLAGYLYSGIVLGVGIPKLNIAVTKALSKKNPEEAIVESKEAVKSTPTSVLAEVPKTIAESETSLIKQKILSTKI